MTDLENDSHHKYNKSETYSVETITNSLQVNFSGYSANLLSIKAETIKSLVKGKRVLDIGCADGRHLAELSGEIETGIGIDFSERFVAAAQAKYGNIQNLSFLVGDARSIKLPSGTVDVIYSFSTLYNIDEIDKVYSEINRLLVPGGVALLELGNARSLTTKISRRPENAALAQHSGRTIAEHQLGLRNAGLEIVMHRSFQILPMWGNLDGILKILRKPSIDRIMTRRFGSRMLDEWISSLPIFRNFAFRHLILCRKPQQTGSRS